MSTDKIAEKLTVRDFRVARLVQFGVSMKPNLEALEKGYLDLLRVICDRGIVYVRGRCDQALSKLLGVE